MPHKLRAVLGLFGFVLATAAIFVLLFTLIDLRRKSSDSKLVIGSKADTEGLLLAEIMARLIERRAYLKVERRTNLGGTQICFSALRAGQIDLYPEYTGTALMAILDRPLETDPKRAFQLVRGEFFRLYQLELLEPLAFNNTYALAMSEALSRSLGITKLSDLAGHPELRAGFTAEFLARRDGYPGLRERYGLRFQEEPKSMEAGLMYGAVASGQVDVIGAYATDGRIDKLRLVVLADDKRFFPPYQAAPLVRGALLLSHPRVRQALGVLRGRLSDSEMRKLNAQVDIEGKSPAEVAQAYVNSLPP